MESDRSLRASVCPTFEDGLVGGGETQRTTAHLSNAIDDRAIIQRPMVAWGGEQPVEDICHRMWKIKVTAVQAMARRLLFCRPQFCICGFCFNPKFE